MEEAIDDEVEISLPEVGWQQHMTEAMIRLGPIKADGMGQRAADWTEIYPFAKATGRISSTWEHEALYDMCASYFLERTKGENPFCVPPMDRE